MTGWMRVTTASGYAVFATPALFAAVALAATVAWFGPAAALAATVLPLAWLLAPLALWTGYCRHHPSTGRAAAPWAGLGLVVVAMLAASPIWFWSLPAAVVVVAELRRAVLTGHAACPAAAAPALSPAGRPHPPRRAPCAYPPRCSWWTVAGPAGDDRCTIPPTWVAAGPAGRRVLTCNEHRPLLAVERPHASWRPLAVGTADHPPGHMVAAHPTGSQGAGR